MLFNHLVHSQSVAYKAAELVHAASFPEITRLASASICRCLRYHVIALYAWMLEYWLPVIFWFCAQASELKRLAVYLDVNATLWEPPKPWAQLQRTDWDDLFLGSITAGSGSTAVAARVAHTYVLKPVDGQLHYTRRGRNVRRDESQAIQEASINLQTISLHVSRGYPSVS